MSPRNAYRRQKWISLFLASPFPSPDKTIWDRLAYQLARKFFTRLPRKGIGGDRDTHSHIPGTPLAGRELVRGMF
jgi:hypothetical protein